MQSVSQELFQQLLTIEITKEMPTREQEPIILTPDELNAMQYACGYVPYKLLKKYEKKMGLQAECFVKCLGNMAVKYENDQESDLLGYTKSRIEKVNGGGLFPLNDETFYLFIEIEKEVRSLLPQHIIDSNSCKNIGTLIDEILRNEEIQVCWAIEAVNIESEEQSQALLREIVNLWTTIRGFSIAAIWMETYKEATKETTQKSTGLRKHLS